jgi:hypothetical protein
MPDVSLQRCDLCNREVGPAAQRFSPQQVKTAVRAGLRPPGDRAAMGAAYGVTEGHVRHAWEERVLSQTTGWALCDGCAFQMEPYLARGTWQQIQGAVYSVTFLAAGVLAGYFAVAAGDMARGATVGAVTGAVIGLICGAIEDTERPVSGAVREAIVGALGGAVLGAIGTLAGRIGATVALGVLGLGLGLRLHDSVKRR